MSRSVLVVEPDLDALGAIASKLRARGLDVVIADGPTNALERARVAPPDAVIVAARLLEETGLKARFAANPTLSGTVVFTLHGQRPNRALHADELDASEVEDIARRMLALPGRTSSAVSEGGDVRGNLQQIGILDLLQL